MFEYVNGQKAYVENSKDIVTYEFEFNPDAPLEQMTLKCVPPRKPKQKIDIKRMLQTKVLRQL